MKQKILAMIVAFTMVISALCVPTKANAMEGTPGIVEKVIEKIEVIDTPSKILFQSLFTKENIVLQVTYDDKTVELVRPDKEIALDTKKIGKQTITVEYKGVSVEYPIEIVPRQVQGLKVNKADKTSAVIEWQALTEAEKYEIYTSTKENGTFTLLKSLKKTSFDFTNLVRGKIIYVKVCAVANDMVGEYSDVIQVAPKPDSVKKVIATKNVKTKVALAWEKSEGATGYLVYYRLSDSKDYKLAGSTSELSFEVTGLTSGSNYYFQVCAYAGEQENMGEPSPEVLYGTAPSIPTITKVRGGDKRIKVYWSKGSGADYYNIYFSTKVDSGFKLYTTLKGNESKLRAIDGLKKKKKYYVKVEAVRTVSAIAMKSESVVKSATTASKKAKATSTKAKYFTTLKKFKKSKAYKSYKQFRKKVSYKKSYVVPGLKTSNIGGFNATRMVPQSIAFAGDYLLISAYDYSKKNESVIYVVDKKTKKYRTTIVLPHTGHVGGIAFDGVNIWITYGKKLQAFKFTHIQNAVMAGKPYYELYDIVAVCQMPETVSYVVYAQDRIWAGAYSETAKKYMYGYTIQDKWGTPSLINTNRMLMPNRTQGVAFTKEGKMIVSRSCQTKKGRRGFMSRLDVYEPTWDWDQSTIKKNSKKKTFKLPPMNEGIAISGSYTYVIYESSAFSECKAPLDRITAFKTTKISE